MRPEARRPRHGVRALPTVALLLFGLALCERRGRLRSVLGSYPFGPVRTLPCVGAGGSAPAAQVRTLWLGWLSGTSIEEEGVAPLAAGLSFRRGVDIGLLGRLRHTSRPVIGRLRRSSIHWPLLMPSRNVSMCLVRCANIAWPILEATAERSRPSTSQRRRSSCRTCRCRRAGAPTRSASRSRPPTGWCSG